MCSFSGTGFSTARITGCIPEIVSLTELSGSIIIPATNTRSPTPLPDGTYADDCGGLCDSGEMGHGAWVNGAWHGHRGKEVTQFDIGRIIYMTEGMKIRMTMTGDMSDYKYATHDRYFIGMMSKGSGSHGNLSPGAVNHVPIYGSNLCSCSLFCPELATPPSRCTRVSQSAGINIIGGKYTSVSCQGTPGNSQRGAGNVHGTALDNNAISHVRVDGRCEGFQGQTPIRSRTPGTYFVPNDPADYCESVWCDDFFADPSTVSCVRRTGSKWNEGKFYGPSTAGAGIFCEYSLYQSALRYDIMYTMYPYDPPGLSYEERLGSGPFGSPGIDEHDTLCMTKVHSTSSDVSDVLHNPPDWNATTGGFWPITEDGYYHIVFGIYVPMNPRPDMAVAFEFQVVDENNASVNVADLGCDGGDYIYWAGTGGQSGGLPAMGEWVKAP